MKIRIEKFEDKSEMNADCASDYCYEGLYYHFEDSEIKVTVKAYSDSLHEAAFLSWNGHPFCEQTIRHPLLKEIESYLLKNGFTSLKILSKKSGRYEIFPYAETSEN